MSQLLLHGDDLFDGARCLPCYGSWDVFQSCQLLGRIHSCYLGHLADSSSSSISKWGHFVGGICEIAHLCNQKEMGLISNIPLHYSSHQHSIRATCNLQGQQAGMQIFLVSYARGCTTASQMPLACNIYLHVSIVMFHRMKVSLHMYRSSNLSQCLLLPFW